MSYTNLKLFALSSNQELAAKVADKIGLEWYTTIKQLFLKTVCEKLVER